MLRILYTQELRKLQSLVDDTIVEVQEYTSNPRTDSALGRTGR
jgi:RLL motif containing protein 1